MTQHKPPQAMTLFDLIARTWDAEAEVRALRFNGKGTSLAAQLAGGRLAFFAVTDAESPESRIRIEADTGRASIRPRSKPLPPPVFSDAPIAHPGVPLERLGEQGFAFAHAETGFAWRATARGQTLAMADARKETVTAAAALPRAHQIALAHGNRLVLANESRGGEMAGCTLDHDIERIAISPDATQIACWGAGHLSVVGTSQLRCQARIACEGKISRLVWSPCQRWLAAGCADKAVLVVDAAAGSADRIVDFPAPVHAVEFSRKANALIASGAFRVAGWSLPDLPFGDHGGTPIKTGKPGLTVVDRVAAHPKRDLCAVSYGTGLVTLCRIGHPDEMLVREGTGAAVTAMAWSDDGAHLSIGGADGSLSIVSFPKQMFK